MKYQAITLIGVLICIAMTSGCSSSNIHRYTQSQLSALTTRNVTASKTESYNAATDAMFDIGFTIDESDLNSGILTGERSSDRTAARIWVSPYIRDTRHKMTVLIRVVNASECTVRLSMSKNGEAYVDEKVIDEFWRKMKRQVLLKEIVTVEDPE